MNFKSPMWYRIAVGFSILNLVGGGYAIGEGEPTHAVIHGMLALASWLWAGRLLQGPRGSEGEARIETGEHEDRLEGIETEMNQLRQQLSETQERLDFAERMLARGADKDRAGPQR
jgi:hypothetical protein